MISRHSNENTINFLEKALFGNKDDQALLGKNMNFSEKARKEASELEATGLSRSEREESEVTEDSLLGVSRSLLEFAKREEKKAEAEPKKAEREDWQEIKAARKLDNNQAVQSRFADAILSAGGSGKGGISNLGGSSRQYGSRTQNSIFDSEVLDRLAKEPDNREKTKEEKLSRDQYRNTLRQETLDSMVEGLKNVETRKDSTVTNLGEFVARSSNYTPPRNNISMFDDDKNFSRVPDKTEGEIDKDLSRQPREKDTSWREVKGSSRINNVLDNLFNQLTKDKE